MNDLLFIILVAMGQNGQSADFKSPMITFPTVAACEDKRKEMFEGHPDIYKRSACAAVFPSPKEEVKEPEKTTCVRPPSDGWNSGKPCVKV